MTKNKSKKSPKGFLKGTFIGALTGSIAALLLAPQSGKKTRHQLKNKAESGAKEAKVRGQGAWGKLKEAGREVKQVVGAVDEDKAEARLKKAKADAKAAGRKVKGE